MRKKQKCYLYLTEGETRLIVGSLIRFKNKLIREGRYTDIVDEVILKILGAPTR